MVHVPHEDAGSMTRQRRWLRYLPALGVCLLPAGPNAGHQARLEAGARHERTLEGVACMPWLDALRRRHSGVRCLQYPGLRR